MANTNLKLVEKSFKDELFFLLNKMNPDSRRKLTLQVNTIFLETLAKGMSSKDLMEWRDKHMPEIIKERSYFATTDLVEKFGKILVEKKRSEFKGIKGGAPAEENKANALRGEFNL